MDYFHLIVLFSIYAILAMGLNLITGYCGLFNLAHAAFYAIGAFAYAIIAARTGTGAFLISIMVGGVLAVISSAAISVPAWRLKDDAYLLLSLAVQALIFSILYNWYLSGAPVGSLANLTNGPYGIQGIPGPALFGIEFNSPSRLAALALLCVSIAGTGVYLLIKSPWGRLLTAVRDDEGAARSIGKNAAIARAQAVAIACFLASFAGVIYAAHMKYVIPLNFTSVQSVLFLSMVLLGGAGSFFGPFIGAAIMMAVPEILRKMDLPEVYAAYYQQIIFGLLLIIIVHLKPQIDSVCRSALNRLGFHKEYP